jgi:hypothetical protein
VPLVLRCDRSLGTIEAAAFLEGWQSVGLVPRPLDEDRWQPVAVAVLPDGDVIVTHDGGHTAGPDPEDPAHFYHVGDHVSRLAPDLRARRWRVDVFTPEVAQPRAAWALGLDVWPHATLGNTRIMDLAVRDDGAVVIAGWSAPKTSSEPWWAPFCYRLDPADGRRLDAWWTVDPTDGDGERLGGLVSDSLVRAVAFDDHGQLLACLNADGGNAVIRRHPADWRQTVAKNIYKRNVWGMSGRLLFWGMVARVDLDHGTPLGGALSCGFVDNKATTAWPQDIAPLAGGGSVVVGRHSTGFIGAAHPTWGGVGRGS